MTPEQIIQSWYERVWVDGDLSAIDEFFTPETEANGLLSDLAAGPEDLHALVPAVRRLIRDMEVTVEKCIPAGDWLWSLIRMEAHTANSMERVTLSGQVMMRLEAGRIVEAYNHFDLLTMLETLGLLPRDTLALCLSGERIG